MITSRGNMAAAYLAIPVKGTSDVDLVKPLKKFIKSNFSETSPEDYEKALTDFNRLRAQAVGKFNDRHESAIEAVSRYYDQFVEVEKKLPFTEDQVRINFTWYDAFGKGSLLSSRPKLSIALGSFERAALLFNISAIQSQVASVQSRDTDDGLKLSARLLQQSSGILKHLKDNIMSYLGRDPTPDLHPDTLSALCALMLAQAQESIYQKCALDKMKDAIVAKIAMQCSTYYSEALKLLQLYSVKDVWPRDWIPIVAGKQAAFHALAEYYQSGVASTAKSYGEEIARLQQAKELTQQAIRRGGKDVDFNTQFNKIETALKKATKDNDFIYHDKIPDIKNLKNIEKAVVAKPLPVPEQMSKDFTDLFVKLVPLAVHGAMAAYEAKKSQLVNGEIARLRDATQLMNTTLSTLNLPAAIEDISGTEVPTSVQEKAKRIQELGGLPCLDSLISELPELLNRNKDILDELLDEEAASDMQLKEQFGEKWTRTPSAKLTEGIRTEGNKYRSILNNAIQADSVVKEKYGQHKRGFEMLSLPLDSLQSALPSSNSLGSLKDSSDVKKLRSLMNQVDAIKAEREVLENELKTTNSDMMSKFVSALAADGAIDEESLSGIELQTIYGPFTQQVNESLERQGEVLSEVQMTHESFSRAKMSDQSGAEREKVLRELAAAYDAFIELKGNLEEGTRFYNDLTQILVKFQSKISDLCFARKTEKEELMKDLNQQIASQPAQAVPTTPTYQNPKPSRPPPPKPSTAATSAPAPSASIPSSAPSQPSAAAAPPAAAASAPSAPGYPPAGQQPVAPGYPPQPYPYYTPVPTGYNPYGYGTAYYQNPPPPSSYGYGMPQQGQAPYPTQGQAPYPQYQQQYPGYPYPQQPNYPGYGNHGNQ